MDTVIVNGVEYVESDHVCVIADRGWIFEGRRVPCDGDGYGDGYGNGCGDGY